MVLYGTIVYSDRTDYAVFSVDLIVDPALIAESVDIQGADGINAGTKRE